MTSYVPKAVAALDESGEIEDVLKDATGVEPSVSCSTLRILSSESDPTHVQNLLSDLQLLQVDEARASNSLMQLYDTYLQRSNNKSEATISQYRRTIPPFIELTTSRGVTDPVDCDRRVVNEYIDFIFEEYDVDATRYTHTKNVAAFLRWMYKNGHVDEKLYTVLDKDELGLSPAARDEAVSKPEADCILKRLRTQRYGTRLHALMGFCWNTGARISGIHSLDVEDFKPDLGIVQFVHRPDQGTRLKLGERGDAMNGTGERGVTLHPRVIEALQEYIECYRPEVTDSFGREPLFATDHGRASKSTLRRWFYEATSCRWNVESDVHCNGNCSSHSNICPCSYYPHAVRRGAIVSALKAGMFLDTAAARFNVNKPTLRKHYDPRSDIERAQDRAEIVESTWKKKYA